VSESRRVGLPGERGASRRRLKPPPEGDHGQREGDRQQDVPGAGDPGPHRPVDPPPEDFPGALDQEHARGESHTGVIGPRHRTRDAIGGDGHGAHQDQEDETDEEAERQQMGVSRASRNCPVADMKPAR